MMRSAALPMTPLPAHVDDHWLHWQPGTEGKGFILTNGRVWTWPTGDGDQRGRPMHMMRAGVVKRLGGQIKQGTPFHITPEGGLWQFGPGRTLDHFDRAVIAMADPRIKPVAAPGDAESFGHGPDVYERLRSAGWRLASYHVYHVAPREAHDAIMAEGLRGHELRNPAHEHAYRTLGQPRGNYFFHSLGDAMSYGDAIYSYPTIKSQYEDGRPKWETDYANPYFNVYKTNVTGLPVVRDPESALHADYRNRPTDWFDTDADSVQDRHSPTPGRLYTPVHVTPDRIQHVDISGFHPAYEEGELPQRLDQAPMTQWLWPGHESKTAGMTLPQQLRQWSALHEALPDNSSVVHTFDNGYTVRHLPTYGDVGRVGAQMNNCWQGRRTFSEPRMMINKRGEMQYHSLHDEHGLPRVAFFVGGEGERSGRGQVHEPMAARNQRPLPEHEAMLQQFAEANGLRYTNNVNYDHPIYQVGVAPVALPATLGEPRNASWNLTNQTDTGWQIDTPIVTQEKVTQSDKLGASDNSDDKEAETPGQIDQPLPRTETRRGGKPDSDRPAYEQWEDEGGAVRLAAGYQVHEYEPVPGSMDGLGDEYSSTGRPFIVDHGERLVHLGWPGASHTDVQDGGGLSDPGTPGRNASEGWVDNNGAVNFFSNSPAVWHGSVANALGEHLGAPMPLGWPYKRSNALWKLAARYNVQEHTFPWEADWEEPWDGVDSRAWILDKESGTVHLSPSGGHHSDIEPYVQGDSTWHRGWTEDGAVHYFDNTKELWHGSVANALSEHFGQPLKFGWPYNKMGATDGREQLQVQGATNDHQDQGQHRVQRRETSGEYGRGQASHYQQAGIRVNARGHNLGAGSGSSREGVQVDVQIRRGQSSRDNGTEDDVRSNRVSGGATRGAIGVQASDGDTQRQQHDMDAGDKTGTAGDGPRHGWEGLEYVSTTGGHDRRAVAATNAAEDGEVSSNGEGGTAERPELQRVARDPSSSEINPHNPSPPTHRPPALRGVGNTDSPYAGALLSVLGGHTVSNAPMPGHSQQLQLAQHMAQVDAHPQTLGPGVSMNTWDLTGNRPSFKEFLVDGNIREDTEFADTTFEKGLALRDPDGSKMAGTPYDFGYIGDDDPWLNFMGDHEAFEDEPEAYATSQGVNAYHGDQLAGSLVWDRDGAIRHIYVHPDHRGRGLMTQMLNHYDGPGDEQGDNFIDPQLHQKVRSILDNRYANRDPEDSKLAGTPGVPYYHGTSSIFLPQIQSEGLKRGERSGVYLTDDHDAAMQYAQELAQRKGGKPTVLGVNIPPHGLQPNGTPAPPFFHDDWHEQSGMPGSAWEYDGAIPADALIHPLNRGPRGIRTAASHEYNGVQVSDYTSEQPWGEDIWGERRPALYTYDDNHLWVGQPGDIHGDLHRSLGFPTEYEEGAISPEGAYLGGAFRSPKSDDPRRPAYELAHQAMQQHYQNVYANSNRGPSMELTSGSVWDLGSHKNSMNWWEGPGHPEYVYHAAPVAAVPQIMKEGLKPMVGPATRKIYPNAQPYVHALHDVDELHERFGHFLHDAHGPTQVLKVPGHYFEHWLGVPDEEWGALDDDSGREQGTFTTNKVIPPHDIVDTGHVFHAPLPDDHYGSLWEFNSAMPLHQFNWVPGQPGKGFITPTGLHHNWVTDGYQPHHFDYMTENGISPRLLGPGASYYEISPTGVIDYADKSAIGQIMRHDPRLHTRFGSHKDVSMEYEGANWVPNQYKNYWQWPAEYRNQPNTPIWFTDDGAYVAEKRCPWCLGKGCEKCDDSGTIVQKNDTHINDEGAEGMANVEDVVHTHLPWGDVLPIRQGSHKDASEHLAWGFGKPKLVDPRRYEQATRDREDLWQRAYQMNADPRQLMSTWAMSDPAPKWHTQKPENAAYWRPDDDRMTDQLARGNHGNLNWEPEHEAQWQKGYQERMRQQFLADPNARTEDYEQWLQWYAQHNPQHFDPEAYAAQQEVAPQEPAQSIFHHGAKIAHGWQEWDKDWDHPDLKDYPADGMPRFNITPGNPDLPLYRYVHVKHGDPEIDRLMEEGHHEEAFERMLPHIGGDRPYDWAGHSAKNLGMHWTHDPSLTRFISTEESNGMGAHGVILRADHPGVEHTMSWENPQDANLLHDTVFGGPDSGVHPEVAIRPNAPMNVTGAYVMDDQDRTHKVPLRWGHFAKTAGTPRWEPGNYGKFIVLPDGQIHDWKTYPHADYDPNDSRPTHGEYLKHVLPQYLNSYYEDSEDRGEDYTPGWIHPDGHVETLSAPIHQQRVRAVQERIGPRILMDRFRQTQSSWDLNKISGGYNHGDMFVCNTCGSHEMTEPRPLGSGWSQTCAKCGRSRMVDPTHPLINAIKRMQPAYPQQLAELNDGRPMNMFGKTAAIPTGFGDMYHVSPRRNRESIMTNGLTGSQRDSIHGSPWNLTQGQPAGNYFFDNAEDARDYVYNLHGNAYKNDLDAEPDIEDMYEYPETPHDFDNWDEDRQMQWEDSNHPTMKTEDPKGYDIWRVQMHGHPLAPDPESELASDDHWNLGDIHNEYERAAEEWPGNLEAQHTEVGMNQGSEPKRYYSPTDIHPAKVQLHQHVPTWDLNSEDYYDRQEENYDREIPSVWNMLPMTERPMPGHEGKTAALPVPGQEFTIHNPVDPDFPDSPGSYHGEKAIYLRPDKQFPGTHYVDIPGKMDSAWVTNSMLGIKPTYFHQAPTEDRARIQQHGLQVSDPEIDMPEELQGKWRRSQPGVYTMPEPWQLDSLRGFDKFKQPHDVWEIVPPGPHATLSDPDTGGHGRIFEQNVDPSWLKLHQPWEMNPVNDHLWPKRGTFDLPEGNDHRLGWQPGMWGKALFDEQGNLHTWDFNAGPKLHDAYAIQNGITGVPPYMSIRPSGAVQVGKGGPFVHAIERIDPNLKVEYWQPPNIPKSGDTHGVAEEEEAESNREPDDYPDIDELLFSPAGHNVERITDKEAAEDRQKDRHDDIVSHRQSDYYHVAPTYERQRILQHGLQPSRPALNERWEDQDPTGEWLPQQPKGVYVTERPNQTWNWSWDHPEKHHWDTWRIPKEQVPGQRLIRDEVAGAWVIPHEVHPILHEPGEENAEWPQDMPAPEVNRDELNMRMFPPPATPPATKLPLYERRYGADDQVTHWLPPVLFHWTEAHKKPYIHHHGFDRHGIYLTRDEDVDTLNADVPRTIKPLRVAIDTAHLDPDLFGQTDTEGYAGKPENALLASGNVFYTGPVPREAILGMDQVVPPGDWDLDYLDPSTQGYETVGKVAWEISPQDSHQSASLWTGLYPRGPVAPTSEPSLQGRMCFFHPDRPAVRAEGFAAMCEDCAQRYDEAKQQVAMK